MPHQGDFFARNFAEDSPSNTQTFSLVLMPKTQLIHTTMAHLRDWSSIKKLKACPLCGSLNVVENEECFACRWQGEFESDTRLIQLRIAELAIRSPELRILWTPVPTGNKFRRALNNLKDRVVRFFRLRNLDFRA